MLSDPGEANEHLPVALTHVDFRVVNHVILPISRFRGSITSAFAYGLLSRSLCAYPLALPPPDQSSLSGGWPAFPERASLPLK